MILQSWIILIFRWMQSNKNKDFIFQQFQQSQQSNQVQNYQSRNNGQYIHEQMILQQSQLDSIQQSSSFSKPRFNQKQHQQPLTRAFKENQTTNYHSEVKKTDSILPLQQNASFKAYSFRNSEQQRKESQIIISGLLQSEINNIRGTVENETSKQGFLKQKQQKTFQEIHNDKTFNNEVNTNRNNRLKSSTKKHDFIEQNYRTEDVLRQNEQAPHIQPLAQKPLMKNKNILPSIFAGNKFKDSQSNTSSILINNESSMIKMKRQDQPSNRLQLQYNNDSIMKLPSSNKINSKLSQKVVPSSKNLKCILKRQKTCCINYYRPQFTLTLKDMTFLINAKKQFGNINSRYNITAQQGDFNKSSPSIMGYLKANFVGSQFNLFSLSANGQQQLICTIVYYNDCSCIAPFIRMQVYVKNQDYHYNELYGYDQNEFKSLHELYPLGYNIFGNRIRKLITKVPVYNHKINSYVLKFNKKNILSSVKNMILIDQKETNKNILLFCKMEKNSFCLQIGHPLSPLIAMGIVLSSFDFKIYCQ